MDLKIDIKTVIIVFVLFSFFGWLWESYLHGKYACGDTLMKSYGWCIPFLTIYGFGAILLLVIRSFLPDMNKLELSLVAMVVLTVMECIVGNMSLMVNGYQTWNYGTGVCKGYISFKASMIWFMSSYIFYSVLVD